MIRNKVKPRTQKQRIDQAIVKLLAEQEAWWQNIAPLRHHRQAARTHELRQKWIKQRRDKILRDLDADEHAAVMVDKRLNMLLGTHGCRDAEVILGG